MKKKIAVLEGDGIGKEVMAGALDVLRVIEKRFHHHFEFVEGKIGGSAIGSYGVPLPEETLRICREADAILLGAVGGPKWEGGPSHLRPEKGLLGLRKEMGFFANFRPVKAVKSLISASPLKREVVENIDFVLVRELTGGIYFGKPSGRFGETEPQVVDTLRYSKHEMVRVIEKAFQLARTRRKKLTSVDKANVLESSKLWREVVEETASRYADVEVEHLLVDAAAMKLIQTPRAFDVIVTENLFGDILSDEASMLTGSLGMMPSASLREDNVGLYEPIHGSAPDIAGTGKANPLAMILSAAMMLRYSFHMVEEADAIELAVYETLEAGYHTPDLAVSGGVIVNTKTMIRKIIDHLSEDEVIAGIMATFQ